MYYCLTNGTAVRAQAECPQRHVAVSCSLDETNTYTVLQENVSIKYTYHLHAQALSWETLGR